MQNLIASAHNKDLQSVVMWTRAKYYLALNIHAVVLSLVILFILKLCNNIKEE